MASPEPQFRYVAVDGAGRRVRGQLSAGSESQAFERLRRDGLSPTTLRPAPARTAAARTGGVVSDRDTAEILGNLGELLRAGADMRTALDILGARAARPPVARLCRDLIADISGGEALERAFSRHFGRHQAFVGAMVAAGEASGDLAGGLSRAAEMLDAGIRLRGKLVSILAYPAFVLASTVVAVLALLLFVIPALAPLTEDTGGTPPVTLQIMIWASEALRANMIGLVLGMGLVVLAAVLAGRLGLLGQMLDRLALIGPARGIVAALTYGGLSIALGGMLAAGAPMSEALRLAIRSVGSKLARARLEPVMHAVRQGRSLSDALGEVSGFPAAITRLAAVGEATNTLGSMLTRGGKLEEETAVRRIETIGQILGPALIVGLGGVVGLLMAGLLSGVSQLGQSALQ